VKTPHTPLECGRVPATTSSGDAPHMKRGTPRSRDLLVSRPPLSGTFAGDIQERGVLKDFPP